MPLYLFIPINDTKIVFIGSEKGFYGNNRHLFEYMNKTASVKAQYYTNQKDVINKYANLPMLKSYNIINLFKLINTNVVVTDHGIPWYVGVFAFRAKKVQLWHGNGMKKIGKLFYKKGLLSNIRLFLSSLVGTNQKFQYVYYTSLYAYKHRKGAFRHDEYKFNGQPRNDIMFENTKESKRVFYEIIGDSNLNKKVIIYTPTWRDEKNDFNSFKNVDFLKLDGYLKSHNLLLVVKFHPYETETFPHEYNNIITIKSNVDVYDILQYTSAMITDYSSIYFDYLLLDKPIIFFPFDKEDYLNNQRDIVYNYEDITPGKQVFNTDELIEEIDNILVKEQDNYIKDRKRVRDLFYKYQDNKSRERASNDILELMGIKNEKV